MAQKRKNKLPLSEKKKRLNELGYEWVKLAGTENEAAYNAKWFEIWELLFDIYYPFLREESEFAAFEETIRKTKEKYNGSSPLSSFFTSHLRFGIIDEMRAEKEDTVLDDNTEDDEGKEMTKELEGDDGGLTEVEDEDTADSAFFEIASAIHNFSVNHNRKSGNDTRRNYYRLFFTSGITSYIKLRDKEPRFQHRRDITQSMNGRFVNFCTVDVCRNLSDIFWSNLKKLDAVVDDAGRNKGKPIPLPIPDIVGISYLNREEDKKVSKSTYSEQKQSYKKEMFGALLAGGIIERTLDT